jgi:pimeloyl-ACP methyl ester carboxylesterase
MRMRRTGTAREGDVPDKVATKGVSVVRFRAARVLIASLLAAAGLVAVPSAADADDVKVYTGTFDGLPYKAEVPAHWNGTLLLYSNVNDQALLMAGYPESEKWLLDHHYALAGASTKDIRTTLNGQRTMLDWFGSHVGRPRRTISWGQSLGGVSAALLAEREPWRFDGLGALCAPLGGLISQWNSFLDLNFVTKTLLAPDSDWDLVDITDLAGDTAEQKKIVQAAEGTPAGRARLALANAVADVPAWFSGLHPHPTDPIEEIHQLVHFDVSVFGITGGIHRQTYEKEAGGNASWNTGVDYRRLLAQSSERDLAVKAYKAAGLDLNKDLSTLARAPRIAPDPRAVAYQYRYGTPQGSSRLPTVTLHTTGDGASQVEHERQFAAQVRRHGNPAGLRQLFVGRGWHCTYTASEEIVMLQTLLDRVHTGHWRDTDPAALNAAAERFPATYQQVLSWYDAGWGQVQPDFIRYTPGRFGRPFPAWAS